MAGTDHWMDEGSCFNTGMDFFTDNYWEVKACVLLCASCPVRIQCLKFALDNNIEHGIWGGVKGNGLNLLRDYRRRGRYIKQLDENYTNDWAIGGKWEKWAGWEYQEEGTPGRPRGDAWAGRGWLTDD